MIDTTMLAPTVAQMGEALRYLVYLPENPLIPPLFLCKAFIDHDTFAAYLRVWNDLGYAVTSSFANVAHIGVKA